MTKKLRNLSQLKIDPGYRRYLLLPNIILVILYLFSISQMSANYRTEDSKTVLEDFTDYPKIVRSYNITDASTEDKVCFPTKGKGVIFQRADGCQGSHHIWRVADKLTMNEYDNDTATIVGSVIDDNGKIGKVNIALYNKSNTGNTWQAPCYLEGITDPRSLYQEFNGTITIDGQAFSVEIKQAEQHYIVSDGAGFEPGQYGFGAWTGGTFGGCTEWFGNLDPIEVNCELTVDAGEDISNCNIEDIVLTANIENESDCANIVSSYKIIDSQLEPGCFTADPGVIFTKGQNCSESLTIWSAQNDLVLNEYDNNTAKISGSVKNQYGKIGVVDVTLSDKEYTGTTWNANCYLDGISGKETYYRSFNGTVTVDGVPMTVGTRFNAHYILANGAGFDSNQYGLGAWTGGSFGSCTEWFGNLVPTTIDNSHNKVNYEWSTTDGNITGASNQQTITVDKAGTYIVKAADCKACEAIDTVIVTELPGPTVDAGDDIEVCNEDTVELSAVPDDISECAGGCEYPIERTPRCHDASNLSDVWLNNTSGMNKGFVTSSSKFETFDDGSARYTAIGTNGLDNIEVDITFAGYTTVAPQDSPKENNCETYDTTDWVYWTHTSGTIKTEQHGILTISRAGPSMQMGNGGDTTRAGFGASGWLTVTGGDGYYIGGDLNIKLDDCVAIPVDNDASYLWSTTDGNIIGDANQKTISVDKSGTYTVTVSDCESCEATDEVLVTILAPKAYSLEGGDNFCIDGEADYLTDDTISVSGNLMGANNTFVVTDINGKILGLPGTLEAVKGINFDEAGAGTCLVWHLSFEGGLQGAEMGLNANDLDGCFNLSNPIEIVRNEAPIANAGDDVTICKGTEVMLTATGGKTYLWSTGETTDTIKVSPTENTTYTVTVTSVDGCEAIDEVIVTVGDATADAGDDKEICKGDEVMLSAEGEGDFLWSTGETTRSIKVNPEVTTEYTVTVINGDCEATDSVMITVSDASVDAGDDQTICEGEEVMLTAQGEGDFLWSTGETTQSIMVSPETTIEYSVIITNGNCDAMDEVMVIVDDKVKIGDYVWLDENRNGIQDDGQIGINGISVELYHCDGTLVDETETNSDGYYGFNVCPGSGDYYIVFGNVPEELKFTAGNEGSDSMDSDADMGGRTSCFTINDEDEITIDAGLIEICDIDLEVIEEVKMCGEQVLELTATLNDNTEECEGGCVYPIIEQDRCYGPIGNFDVWLVSIKDGKKGYHRFKASEQSFETFDDGSARYTATATDGIDMIEVDVLFTDNSNTPGPNGAYANHCQVYDMSDWEYWSTWSGTISSKNHGIFSLTTKGKYFQMGNGADVVRTGFGASGWFFADGGDGYYTDGDINVVLDECIEKSATFEWTTEDGNIISDATERTISIDSPGTYVIEAVNCIDCVAVKTVVVTEDILCSTYAKSANTPKMSTVYPVPVESGSTLTIEFDMHDPQVTHKLQAGSSLTKGTGNSNKENVSVVLYDLTGRMISMPRTFDLIDGKAIIYLGLDYIPSGKYIVKAQGRTWNHSKNIIVR